MLMCTFMFSCNFNLSIVIGIVIFYNILQYFHVIALFIISVNSAQLFTEPLPYYYTATSALLQLSKTAKRIRSCVNLRISLNNQQGDKSGAPLFVTWTQQHLQLCGLGTLYYRKNIITFSCVTTHNLP